MDIIFLELILVVVAALGFGFWQLYDVNKELKKHQGGRGSGDRESGQATDHQSTEAEDERRKS